MKIRIQGREYPFLKANSASLTQLLILKRQSGLMLAGLEAGAQKITEIAQTPDLTPGQLGVAIFSDEAALMTFAASIWLSRWAAGDGLDFEAANDFPLSELEFVTEPGDNQESADPQ